MSSFMSCAAPPGAHRSSPTRRSSDLEPEVAVTADGDVRGSVEVGMGVEGDRTGRRALTDARGRAGVEGGVGEVHVAVQDRKSTRLHSSHLVISYAVFCLQKKTRRINR